MGKVVTYAVELAVGIGCLAGAPSAWRSAHPWLAPLLAVAGLAAVAHAALALVA